MHGAASELGQPLFNVRNSRLELFLADGVLGGVELPFEFRQPQFERRNLRALHGINWGVWHPALTPGGLAFVGQLLNPRVRVNKAFARITHNSHLSRGLLPTGWHTIRSCDAVYLPRR